MRSGDQAWRQGGGLATIGTDMGYYFERDPQGRLVCQPSMRASCRREWNGVRSPILFAFVDAFEGTDRVLPFHRILHRIVQ